jgi:hypothetical protein
MIHFLEDNYADALVLYEEIPGYSVSDFIKIVSVTYHGPWYLLRKVSKCNETCDVTYDNAGIIYCNDEDITDFHVPPQIVPLDPVLTY